jgi:hypothetical protein
MRVNVTVPPVARRSEPAAPFDLAFFAYALSCRCTPSEVVTHIPVAGKLSGRSAAGGWTGGSCPAVLS